MSKGEAAMTEALYAGGASGYDQLFARVTRSFMPVLLEAARIRAGNRVLDVATGTGAAAEAAAALVGPSGEVVAGDISSTMLDVARRNLKDAFIKFEMFDGQALPYPEERFDRVICQMGLMFFDDPARGLAEFRRVLAPDGWTAVTINSTPERSLFTRIGTVIGRYVPAKAEQLNRYASIRTAERLSNLLIGAQFAEIEVHSETRSISFASFDDYFSGTEAGSGVSGQAYVQLSKDLQSAVREDVRLSFPDGASSKPFVIEMEVLVGCGRK
jgi:ubiquinone/menaquinone biosynthesis C-methylase UbiE